MKTEIKNHMEIAQEINGVRHVIGYTSDKEVATEMKIRCEVTAQILEGILIPSNIGIGDFLSIYEILEENF